MTDFRPVTLAEYLTEVKTNYKSALPFLHSTEANNFLHILADDELKTRRCDVFTSDEILYFFCGRPAFRKVRAEPKDWQLPVVLVFESSCVSVAKRIFPFDSGAFAKNLYPDYLTGLGMDGFELSSVEGAIDLLIDTFFGSDEDYFFHQPKTLEAVQSRSRIGVRHAQVKALCSMNAERPKDDRANTIEIQTEQNVRIKDNLLGVVLPRQYYDEPNIRKHLKKRKVVVRPYDVYPLSVESYVGLVYREVAEIYKKMNIMS